MLAETLFSFLNMSLVSYSSSDSETEKECVAYMKKQRVEKEKVIIRLKPLSSYATEDEKNKVPTTNNKDLLSILPPAKHIKNKLFIPRVLSKIKTQDFTVNEKKKRQSSIKQKSLVNINKKENGEDTIPLCNRKNCAPDVKDPNTLKNSNFKEIFSAGIGNVERVHRFDRNLIKSLTDPEVELREEVEDVNNTCKKKNHISYLVQMAKKNEQGLKTQWSNNKFTRQQTRAKYGF